MTNLMHNYVIHNVYYCNPLLYNVIVHQVVSFTQSSTRLHGQQNMKIGIIVQC